MKYYKETLKKVEELPGDDSPAPRRYLVDYHVHPDYSMDAFPHRIRRYCLKALDLQLAEVCLTTHLEHEPHHSHVNNEVLLHGEAVPSYRLHWLEEYFREIEAARKEFAGAGLKVKAGVEIGYNPGIEELIHRVIQGFPFDFVLGAVHSVQGISLSALKECPQYFSSCTLKDLQKDYFGTLEQAVKSGFFDCLAHVDIYRRYGYDFYGPAILTLHRGVIEHILKEAARRNTGLEINTSSIRRGGTEFHPCREILEQAVEAGIKVFSVGSDAHSLNELGDHVEEAALTLEDLGQQVYSFTRRKALAIKEPATPGRRHGGK